MYKIEITLQNTQVLLRICQKCFSLGQQAFSSEDRVVQMPNPGASQDSPGTVQVVNEVNPFGHTGTEEETTRAAQSAKMVTSQCGRYGHQSMWSLWSPVNVVVMTTSQYGLWWS